MKAKLKFEENIILIDKVYHREEFNEFLKGVDIKPPFIVKPNWISGDYGHFTDPKVLIWLLEFLISKDQVVLTESYSACNSIKCPGINSTKLTKDDLERVRRSEKEFLIHTGIYSFLQEFDIEYINITEEVLSKEIVDPNLVQRQVESLYDPILYPELYSFIPEKLYALRQDTFINLAKFKIFLVCVSRICLG